MSARQVCDDAHSLFALTSECCPVSPPPLTGNEVLDLGRCADTKLILSSSTMHVAQGLEPTLVP
jgi:hypothetical protein